MDKQGVATTANDLTPNPFLMWEGEQSRRDSQTLLTTPSKSNQAAAMRRLIRSSIAGSE